MIEHFRGFRAVPVPGPHALPLFGNTSVHVWSLVSSICKIGTLKKGVRVWDCTFGQKDASNFNLGSNNLYSLL